jgi:maltoporin
MKGITMNFKLLPLTVALASVLAPVAASADDSLQFSGYARYGINVTDDSSAGVAGSLTGNSVGRLGNEGNGSEWQLTKSFDSDNGTKWKVGVMTDHWGSSIGLKKFFAKATNVFESQPNAELWAGRDFHERQQTNLSDFFYTMHDGQGGGIKNLELGPVKFDLSVVGGFEYDEQGVGTQYYLSTPGDGGNYAVTTKLHGIKLGSADFSLAGAYGFDTDNAFVPEGGADKAFLVAAVLGTNWEMGSNKFIARYADNAVSSVFNKTEDTSDLYTAVEGSIYLSKNFAVDYIAAYGSHKAATGGADSSNISLIARPMYTWNDIHSTWFEVGASQVDTDGADDVTGWKATISQNVSINGFGNGRPVIRFYVTAGENDTDATDSDVFALGTMFEAWW